MVSTFDHYYFYFDFFSSFFQIITIKVRICCFLTEKRVRFFSFPLWMISAIASTGFSSVSDIYLGLIWVSGLVRREKSNDGEIPNRLEINKHVGGVERMRPRKKTKIMNIDLGIVYYRMNN